MTSAAVSPSWPKRPNGAEFGPARDFVKLIEPHSEADPVALLVQFLAVFGNVVGRRPHFVAEADQHFTNLNLVLVGETAKGRKGSSWGHVFRAFRDVDAKWAECCLASGLSSGEGLIAHVRDPIERLNGDGEPVIVDAGAEDKRLLVTESEFASTLRVLGRDGNTLSPVLRNAWDGKTLQSLVKNSPLKATGAHVSLIGHITRQELLRYLTNTEAGNGFGNRFAYFCVRRSKFLPDGGNVPSGAFGALVARLRNVVAGARRVGLMKRDDAARRLWHEVYPELSEGRPGLLGAMTARAEAQTMRWAVLYALLDGADYVGEPHLAAALALWDYASRSAAYVFGDALGDPIADEILTFLRDAGEDGRTRSELRDLFGRHKSKGTLDRALALLREMELARFDFEETGGRPAERWYATDGGGATYAT